MGGGYAMGWRIWGSGNRVLSRVVEDGTMEVGKNDGGGGGL